MDVLDDFNIEIRKMAKELLTELGVTEELRRDYINNQADISDVLERYARAFSQAFAFITHPEEIGK